MRAAQSDTHKTWIEKKLTKRPSMESFESYNEYTEARRQNQEQMTRQTSYDLKKKAPVAVPTSSKAPVAVPTPQTKPKPPPPAPKPRNSSLSAPVPPPPPEFSGVLPAPVLVSVLSVVADLSLASYIVTFYAPFTP